MEGMSAEEHAHMHGGMAGAIDSTGATVRQTIMLSPEQEQALGVTFATVHRMTLTRSIRTVGRIEVAEQRVVDVTTKIDGFAERLLVATTGASVRRGEPLLEFYSPALVAAQEELLTARRLASRVDSTAGEAWRNAQTMLQAARRRLEYWDITADQVQHIEETGAVSKTLTLVAPASGVVLEKNVIEGQRVTYGERLYRIADLSEVWVEGDVFEQDLELVRVGSQAHIEVSAYPGHHLMGRVSFVYPTMDADSRTNRVRVTVRNTDLRLKPGMFATIFFDVTIGEDVLTVPLEAVVVTGERNIVFVHHDDGTLMPHEVVLGGWAGDHVEILSGVMEGQTIVASANFLVDAESQLGTTGGTMPGMQHGDHGSVIEPDTSGAGLEEHDHD
jgi:Cu(I)/Ag(I) efflux system membrane fusion protein